MQRTTADDISNALMPYVKLLNETRVKFMSVVTDSASNNIKALRALEEVSLQRKSSSFIIRQPCMAHTTMLALSDLFHVTKSKGKYFLT